MLSEMKVSVKATMSICSEFIMLVSSLNLFLIDRILMRRPFKESHLLGGRWEGRGQRGCEGAVVEGGTGDEEGAGEEGVNVL